MTITLGLSSFAFPISTAIRAPKPTLRSGKNDDRENKHGDERATVAEGFGEFLAIDDAILRADMSVGLRRGIVGSDDFDENVLEVLLVMLIAKLRKSASERSLPD